jgi:hypothetical protein
MALNIDRTLRLALKSLHAEKVRIDRQISAVEAALDGFGGRGRGRARAGARPVHRGGRPRRRRLQMSAAARKAVSQRMKAYWAKRRNGDKEKGASGKRVVRRKETAKS